VSKNISNLSGRIGLKDNLFKQISENTLSDTPKDIKEIAKEQKHLFVMEVLVCVQEPKKN
jgi:hypothetical protein